MSEVAIVRCDRYDQDLVDTKVEEVCRAAHMPDPRGKTVLVKPNILSDAQVKQCVTTNPAVLKAMIRLLKKWGAKEVLVGDSPGLQGSSFVPKACGIADACREENVRWVDFTESPVLHVIPNTHGRKLPLAAIADTADMIVSMPKFKTHQLMYTTGALKNLFGLIPSVHKSSCHLMFPTKQAFASMIVGIQMTVRASFALMDGIIGMEGAGPANGTPRPVGCLLASSDLAALDYTEALMMGYDPTDIPIVAEAIRRKVGVCPPDYPLLDANTLIMDDYRRIKLQKRTNLVASLLLPFLGRSLKRKSVRNSRPAPTFLPGPCIRCKRCIAICPAKALTMETTGISLDTGKCIRCYCCHEVCPVNAIAIRNGTERTTDER